MKTIPLIVVLLFVACPLEAADREPLKPGPATRQPMTLYVSRLGDNSDGRNWRSAFRTIQAALDAIPDDLGGHRVIIRPDTYAEANLDSKHKGTAIAYNTIEGVRTAAEVGKAAMSAMTATNDSINMLP